MLFNPVVLYTEECVDLNRFVCMTDNQIYCRLKSTGSFILEDHYSVLIYFKEEIHWLTN